MKYSLTAFFFLFSLSAFAGLTQSHQESSYGDFSKGTLENVQLSNEGQLSPAPVLAPLASLEDTRVIWESVSGDKGDLYVATGGENGAVVQVLPSGEMKTIFTAKEKLIRALAMGKDGALYAGTSPKGALYRIIPGKDPVKLLDSGETYIWSILVDSSGDVFLGTGQKGKIYRLKAGFKEGDSPELWFESDADDFTTLALDAKGALLAGSNTTGLLYRITGKKQAEVLYNASQAQITGIRAEPKGDIYFTTYTAPEPNGNAGEGHRSEHSLFVVKTDGSVLPVWGQAGVSVYGLSPFDENDDAWLLATGDKGRIYRVANTWDWALVAQAEGGGQVSSVVADKRDPAAHFVTTSNPARVYHLGAKRPLKGAYLSEPFDSGQVSHWGKIQTVLISQEGDKAFVVETRSGNTKEANDTWSDWKAVTVEGQIGSPRARFLQYRLRWADSGAQVASVRFFYNFSNLAPEVAMVRVLPVGVGILSVPMPNNQQLSPDMLLAANPAELLFSAFPIVQDQLAIQRERGQMTVVWKAEDPSQDALTFKVEFQPMSGGDWVTLVDEWSLPLYSFSTVGFEEGYYRARVTASDVYANLPDASRSGYRISMPFLVDNTAPGVSQVGQTINNEVVELVFEVEDALSNIVKSTYVLDGKDPVEVLPGDGLFDSKKESFSIVLKRLKSGEHSLLFTVTDESNNTITHPINFTL